MEEPFLLPVLETPIINCMIDEVKIFPSCFGDLLMLLGVDNITIMDSDDFVMETKEELTSQEVKALLYLIDAELARLSSQKAFFKHTIDDIITAKSSELIYMLDKLKKM